MIGDQDQEVGSGGILKHTILPVVAEIGEMPTGEENIGETEGESGQRGSDSREMSIGNYSFNFTFTVLRKKKTRDVLSFTSATVAQYLLFYCFHVINCNLGRTLRNNFARLRKWA